MIRKAWFSDYDKNYLWYIFLFLLDKICSEHLKQTLSHSLFKGVEVGFKLFLIYTLEKVVEALWKQSACTLQWRLGPLSKQNTWTLQLLLRALWKQSTYTLHLLLGPFESKYLQIGVAIGGLFESVVLAHYSCYWGPLWKQSNYTIQLRVGPLWRQSK